MLNISKDRGWGLTEGLSGGREVSLVTWLIFEMKKVKSNYPAPAGVDPPVLVFEEDRSSRWCSSADEGASDAACGSEADLRSGAIGCCWVRGTVPKNKDISKNAFDKIRDVDSI